MTSKTSKPQWGATKSSWNKKILHPSHLLHFRRSSIVLHALTSAPLWHHWMWHHSKPSNPRWIGWRCHRSEGHLVKEQMTSRCTCTALEWRHNGRHGVSNHQPYDCLLNRLFGRRSKKTSKLRVTGLCAGNSPATGEFPAQMASHAEDVSIWWRHHGKIRNEMGHKVHMTIRATTGPP